MYFSYRSLKSLEENVVLFLNNSKSSDAVCNKFSNAINKRYGLLVEVIFVKLKSRFSISLVINDSSSKIAPFSCQWSKFFVSKNAFYK